MNSRCCLFFLILLLVHKVYLQDITAFVGDNVILPCFNKLEALQNQMTVFWRYKDSTTVYNIIDSKESFAEQEKSFKGRVESFPGEWREGNFSIKLTGVKKTDEGQFTCFIPSINFQIHSNLNVKDGAGTRAETGSSNGDIKKRPHDVLLILALLLGYMLLYA